MVDLDHFKFVLYVSFQSYEESIALQLLEAFQQYCQRNGKLSFDLHIRLSDDSKTGTIWDKEFVQAEILKQNVGEVEKIWVCGPPKMNEMFDRTLNESIADGLFPIERHQIEIL